MSHRKLSDSARSWLAATLVVLWICILLVPRWALAERVLIGGFGSQLWGACVFPQGLNPLET